jgi:Kef-type K+ transport system membrane component KefB
MNPLTGVLASITVKSPEGAAWEFLVLFLVVIIGPPLLERARLPGIVGLLLGGYVIGSNGLDLIGSGNTTVPELGQLGLLYLMFVAGVELDLALVRIHRGAVGLFGLLAFVVPMALGSAIGFALHWEVAAALLLGSLMASHTLLVYPTVRNAGLAAHRAVATAVGATVITDTASLVVLAFVSGSQLEGGSAASIALQVVFGLAVLVIFSFLILPRLVRLAFRYLGTDRIVRYLLAIAAFLAAATLATMVGIEGIVGAFFAGLGLNRLVPNEGPLMDRIDFFGSAVFVPIFLVSVGMLLQPSVMVQGETLKFAGLFVVAALAGKAVASGVTGRVLQLSRRETALMWGLTIPQAAATLAATVIGFDIGLFDQSVVNAVLVLILVSIVVATFVVERVKGDVAVPHEDGQRLGHRVLVALEDPGEAELGFEIAARIAAPDTGVVRGLLSCPPGERSAREAGIAELRRVGFSIGVDTDPTLLVANSFADGIVNAVAANEPSLVLVGQRTVSGASALGGPGEAVAAAISAPVAIVVGETARIAEVVLVDAERMRDEQPHNAVGLAVELAERIAGNNIQHRNGESMSFKDLRPGQLCIAPARSWQVLAASDPPEGAALMMVLEVQPAAPLEGDRLWGTAAAAAVRTSPSAPPRPPASPRES